MGIQLRVQAKEAHEALILFADEADRLQRAAGTLGQKSHAWSHQDLGNALAAFHGSGVQLLDKVLGSGAHALELREALSKPATETVLCRFGERIDEIARSTQIGSYPRPTETKLRGSGRGLPTSIDAQHRQLGDEVRQAISAIMDVTHKIVTAIEEREDFASTTVTSFSDADRTFAKLAIEEARKSKSEDDRVHPMVGAVVVRDGKILAKAHRGELGAGDHSEFTVLEKKLANSAVRDATIYVTLEPCTTRKHPKVSCAMRLLERKVSRVVIGMVDPNPVISGRGITALRGGRVEIAMFPEDLASDVEELNRDFIRSFRQETAPPPSAAMPAPPSLSGAKLAPPSSAPQPAITPDLREPLKALLAAVLPESQAHPRIVFLKELLGSEYVIAKVAFRREQKEFWLEAPKFYLTLKRGDDLRQEVFDWHADIEKMLLGLGLRVTDGDEAARGAYLMLQNLSTADAAWGKDYCDAVLCEYLGELFANEEEVMKVVRDVPFHRASSSVHKTECLQYLQQALGGYLGSLMMELKYSAKESQKVFTSAVAKMLDERCHVSASKAMFPR